MKTIIKIALFFSLISSLHANIDEYKSDVYYANGIMMKDSEKIALENWKKNIKRMFTSNLEDYKKILNRKMAYNKSQGFDDDMYEAFEQIMSNEWGWKEFSNYFKFFLKVEGIQEKYDQHSVDITKQVNAYKQSIKNGHGVIAIAHSQGNYFTNEAYDSLDEWMKDYFHMFGVATPANHVAGYESGDTTAPYVKFHNDFINFVITGLASNRTDTHHQGFPSIEAHDFYNSYMTNEETKNDITNFIKKKLDDHVKAPTQWKTKEEIKYGTKEYRIKIEHMFDPSVIVDTEVYPFDPSKKLYQTKDNLQYVKGGYGGIQIQDFWEGQKEGQHYKLEGTDPVEYIEFTCKDPSTFEILSHQNINTKEWRVTVKNKDSNETQESVYPFNLEGSLYELDSGEWVLASCSGESIEETWDGQIDSEVYKLVGTNEIIKIEKNVIFNVKYEFTTFSKYQGLWSRLDYYWVYDANTNCKAESGGSSGDWMPDLPTMNKTILNIQLPNVRREYEYGFYPNFLNGYGRIRSTMICILNNYGYSLSDITSIQRGHESSYIKNIANGTSIGKEAYLEQEYILKIK